jgi:mRNA interferase RelE/StbE
LAWTIEYTEGAKSQLKKLDKQMVRRVMDYMNERVLASGDPRSAGKNLTGAFGGLWRYRIGDIRVICEIQKQALRVLVLKLGHRREVYQSKQ